MAENIAHFTDAHTVLQRYVAEVRERLFVPKQIEREEEWHISIAELATLDPQLRSEEHTSELQSLMRISYAVFCLKKKTTTVTRTVHHLLKHNAIPRSIT